MSELAPLMPFFAAFWFFLAAGYFGYKLRQHRKALGRMYPIALYLLGIGTFFVIQGINNVTLYSCTVVDCSNLTGGLAVMLASAFIARFPLKVYWPEHETKAFVGLVAFSLVTQVGLAFYAPGGLQIQVAHVFGFLVAGLFGVGTIIYEGIVADSTTGKSIGLSMSSCCVVGHGLASLAPLGLSLVVSAPLIGVPLRAPMVFGMLAPISLIAVLAFVARVDPSAAAPDAEGAVETTD